MTAFLEKRTVMLPSGGYKGNIQPLRTKPFIYFSPFSKQCLPQPLSILKKYAFQLTLFSQISKTASSLRNTTPEPLIRHYRNISLKRAQNMNVDGIYIFFSTNTHTHTGKKCIKHCGMYTLVTQTKDKSTQNYYYYYYYSGKLSNFENEKEHINKINMKCPKSFFFGSFQT